MFLAYDSKVNQPPGQKMSLTAFDKIFFFLAVVLYIVALITEMVEHTFDRSGTYRKSLGCGFD
jgi:hypothetical protein